MVTSADTPELQRANLIDGAWRSEATHGQFEVFNPADGRLVATVPAMGPADVADAYEAAARAARGWTDQGPLARAEVLRDAAGRLRAGRDEIAGGLVAEMGKTLGEATIEVTKAADFLDYYAGLARLPIGAELADARGGVRVAVRPEPIGIVVAITPWNDPLLTPARKLAPALFAGNAVILKPATETPVVALRLAEALHSAGLPPGVLGTVTGRGSAIGDALLGDDRLDGVTFTGSTSVGMSLQRQLAGRHVRLQTEMGGKNATAVLADADLELAAVTVAAAAFGQAGQRCTATSRVVVDHVIAEPFLELLRARAATIRLGPGSDASTTMGPVVSPAHQAEILQHIEDARKQGAQVLAGGRAPDDEQLRLGCFVEPTILTGITPAMDIWREEVFGPVVAVLEVDGLAAAIDAVNDSSYGLSAAVFTTSLNAAATFEAEVATGQVSVNLPTSGWDVHHPFGGFAASGSPFKEQGLEGLRFYTRVKTVAVRA